MVHMKQIDRLSIILLIDWLFHKTTPQTIKKNNENFQFYGLTERKTFYWNFSWEEVQALKYFKAKIFGEKSQNKKL